MGKRKYLWLPSEMVGPVLKACSDTLSVKKINKARHMFRLSNGRVATFYNKEKAEAFSKLVNQKPYSMTRMITTIQWVN